MKTILFFSAILTALFTVNISNAQCTRVAPFQNGGYPVNGNATLSFTLGGSKTLNFDSSFSTSQGPDLYVYLSQSSTVSTPSGVLSTGNTIELEQLKNITGSQSYDLASNIELDNYSYVVIHCKAANHGWGNGAFGSKSGVDCNSLGIEDSTLSEQITTYPNPVTDKLHINNNNSNAVQIKFYSILGELLLEEKMSNKKTVDTSHLNSGIYFVELSSDDKKLIRKIIKR